MKHYIIAKFKPEVRLSDILPDVEAIFQKTKSLPGVRGISFFPGVNRDKFRNRYDLMIEMDMDAESLPAYDASDAHHEWKEKYGALIEQKCIFDRE